VKAVTPETTADLQRVLNRAARELGAREITLRFLPPPAVTRWIATALIVHHRVIDKIREDIPAGSLTLQNIGRFNDMPIARGEGATPIEAVKAMTPLKWNLPGPS
jgi:hypothetical protein